MEAKEFKALAERLLEVHGFERKGNHFYRRGDGVICVVYLQRSPHANGYYVSVGFVLAELHPDLEHPRDLDGDMRARFWFEHRGESSDLFDLDDEELMTKIERMFAENVKREVPVPLSIEGIKAMSAKKFQSIVSDARGGQVLSGIHVRELSRELLISRAHGSVTPTTSRRPTGTRTSTTTSTG